MGHGLFESVPNFSEGGRGEIIAKLAAAASGAHVLDVDEDIDHNRAVISLAGLGRNVFDAVLASFEVAVERIDLREHSGVHPRVGSADVIPVIPLQGASLDAARGLARALGERIWTQTRVPVFFYGYGEQHTLADIRAGRVAPTLGGPSLHPTAGAVCVGARKALVAFNVMLPSIDMRAARALARSLRESEGGMRGVQALVFELPGSRIQLSMNLFRIDETTPAEVIAELEGRGIEVGQQQVIGLCPAAVANPAAAGRVLEARLAAAAARRGAELCAALADDEHRRLAGRLEQTAADLAGVGADQGEMLKSAEQAAALLEVLRAAGVLSVELEAMLTTAAEGLRGALDQETLSRDSPRIRALDRRLAGGGPG